MSIEVPFFKNKGNALDPVPAERKAWFKLFSCQEVLVYPRTKTDISTGICIQTPVNHTGYILNSAGKASTYQYRNGDSPNSLYKKGEIVVPWYTSGRRILKVVVGDQIGNFHCLSNSRFSPNIYTLKEERDYNLFCGADLIIKKGIRF